MARARLRDLGITIGDLTPGPLNAITDVPGVTVGHVTLNYDEPSVARTGVTVVMPFGPDSYDRFPCAGHAILNGCGEMTGLPWLVETGLLMSPVALTNTTQVGLVRDAVALHSTKVRQAGPFWLPVAAEIYDGWLSDAHALPITPEHVYAALEAARGGPVEEGNVGGGTGSICHEFKGGIGTSSRRVTLPDCGEYTVGALVQTNQGRREHLLVDGVPVGRHISLDVVPSAWAGPPTSASSIITVVATDAPLLPAQCTALAQRATLGLARTGSRGHTTSGDLFIAFSNGNAYPRDTRNMVEMRTLAMGAWSDLYDAAVESVEEAILNSLTAAEPMTGQKGRVAPALPLDRLIDVMAAHSRGPAPPSH